MDWCLCTEFRRTIIHIWVDRTYFLIVNATLGTLSVAIAFTVDTIAQVLKKKKTSKISDVMHNWD